MFNVMSDCQCLHPDDDDSDYNPEFEYVAAGEGFYTGPDGVENLTAQGQRVLVQLVLIVGLFDSVGVSCLLNAHRWHLS